jgi:hypothetical protein
MPQSVHDDLRRLGAKAGRNTIAVTVIGEKRRLRLPDGTVTRLVPMEVDTPSFTVCTRGVGYEDPSPEDRAAVHAFWKEHGDAPDYYEWLSGQRPPLKIKPKTTTEYRPSHDEQNNEDI